MLWDPKHLPGFLFLDHVAISVKPGELEKQLELYKTLGFSELYREDVLGSDQVREVLLGLDGGLTRIQLLEPLSPESPVARQMGRTGGLGGLLHTAYRVTDVQRAFDYMKEAGFNIIDPSPRRGSRGTIVFFVHPKTTAQTTLGYLIEVVQQVKAP